MAASRATLPDGRWHFQHGPIDLVIGAEGDAADVADAHAAAWRRFLPLLDELVAELPALRRPIGADCPVQGPVARRMWSACAPHRAVYLTPMAAVAGSVAQEIVACYDRPGIRRAWVNNGGDIALHLAPGAQVRVGLVADVARFGPAEMDRAAGHGIATDGRFAVDAALPVRGIATSGWRGRSFSRGIADSVTVLARTAAEADACATLVANAVDVDDARIQRRPACDLKDDSDLGRLPVTAEVPPLGADAVRRALAAGLREACRLRDAGHLWAAALVCQGRLVVAQNAHAAQRPPPPPTEAARTTGAPAEPLRVGSVFA
ncbi:UPF0280 family protein [Xylophilus ampelinus]|uniref:FAD:protein FMN transferase n=1 Tax=Xylophilus ampelinus TaxID=54067 RepID=A0A318SHX6_9BURK|nr:UPF0280 family protein [Xylophilus ampelinus]MCS4509986.1 UPF0280 family protein [Xylophilus ampelinus]PYE78435.1 hypothetical protein DFQ15_10785 [Xylophilus ampelinus]